MNEAIDKLVACLPYLPFTLGPVVLLGLAPLCGRTLRTAFGMVLLLAAAGLGVLGASDAGKTNSVDVVNPFYDTTLRKPVVHVVDKVTAPGWQWPLVAAAALAIPALLLLLRRGRQPGPPRPVLFGTVLGLWCLLARLGLEKTAAPELLVWSLGLTLPTVVLLPFVGGYCGARGKGFGGLALALLLMGLLQRAGLCGLSWLTMTRGLGTHLDVRSIRSVNLPLAGGPLAFGEGDLQQQWLRLVVVPQLTLWVALTVVAGLVLGLVPWLVARRLAR